MYPLQLTGDSGKGWRAIPATFARNLKVGRRTATSAMLVVRRLGIAPVPPQFTCPTDVSAEGFSPLVAAISAMTLTWSGVAHRANQVVFETGPTLIPQRGDFSRSIVMAPPG